MPVLIRFLLISLLLVLNGCASRWTLTNANLDALRAQADILFILPNECNIGSELQRNRSAELGAVVWPLGGGFAGAAVASGLAMIAQGQFDVFDPDRHLELPQPDECVAAKLRSLISNTTFHRLGGLEIHSVKSVYRAQRSQALQDWHHSDKTVPTLIELQLTPEFTVDIEQLKIRSLLRIHFSDDAFSELDIQRGYVFQSRPISQIVSYRKSIYEAHLEQAEMNRTQKIDEAENLETELEWIESQYMRRLRVAEEVLHSREELPLEYSASVDFEAIFANGLLAILEMVANDIAYATSTRNVTVTPLNVRSVCFGKLDKVNIGSTRGTLIGEGAGLQYVQFSQHSMAAFYPDDAIHMIQLGSGCQL